MRLSRILPLLFLSLSLGAQTRWVDPAAQWSTLGPPKGALLICGGYPGGERAEFFLSLLKDPNAPIVVIPTADGKKHHDMNHEALRVLREKGARNLVLLHTYDRRVALFPSAALYPWRGRTRDIQGMVRALLKNRSLLGIGLDQGAAILVSANTARVMGRGKAAFFDPRLPGWPWPRQDEPFLLLDPGDAFDLAARRPDW